MKKVKSSNPAVWSPGTKHAYWLDEAGVWVLMPTDVEIVKWTPGAAIIVTDEELKKDWEEVEADGD